MAPREMPVALEYCWRGPTHVADLHPMPGRKTPQRPQTRLLVGPVEMLEPSVASLSESVVCRHQRLATRTHPSSTQASRHAPSPGDILAKRNPCHHCPLRFCDHHMMVHREEPQRPKTKPLVLHAALLFHLRPAESRQRLAQRPTHLQLVVVRRRQRLATPPPSLASGLHVAKISPEVGDHAFPMPLKTVMVNATQ